jgi:hypothetical protein
MVLMKFVIVKDIFVLVMLHYAFHSVIIFLSKTCVLIVILYYIDLSSAIVWPMRWIKLLIN